MTEKIELPPIPEKAFDDPWHNFMIEMRETLVAVNDAVFDAIDESEEEEGQPNQIVQAASFSASGSGGSAFSDGFVDFTADDGEVTIIEETIDTLGGDTFILLAAISVLGTDGRPCFRRIYIDGQIVYDVSIGMREEISFPSEVIRRGLVDGATQIKVTLEVISDAIGAYSINGSTSITFLEIKE